MKKKTIKKKDGQEEKYKDKNQDNKFLIWKKTKISWICKFFFVY